MKAKFISSKSLFNSSKNRTYTFVLRKGESLTASIIDKYGCLKYTTSIDKSVGFIEIKQEKSL